MAAREYRSDDINVTFDAGRCIHSKECIHGLPEVFDVEKRPWIQPDNSGPDTVAEVVMRCPTGALQFARKDGGDEEPVPEENTVTVAKDGPLYVRGDVEIQEHDGDAFLEDTRIALCRCGESRNKPFCDNSHKNSGFRDAGSLDRDSYEDSSETGGRLEVKLTPNGPLFLKGEFQIRDTEGAPAFRESQAALCRCGHSGHKPFCDGTHGGIGWRDD
ncbi:CDGSH iron-sulfur domain-containing protein [soil metagenome]